MTSLKNDERLSEVLELFLLPNYNIVSTTYLDLLLTHISENIKECKEILNTMITCMHKIFNKMFVTKFSYIRYTFLIYYLSCLC